MLEPGTAELAQLQERPAGESPGGYIEPGMKAKVLKEGVKEFIQKPYDPNDVLRAVRRVLDTA